MSTMLPATSGLVITVGKNKSKDSNDQILDVLSTTKRQKPFTARRIGSTSVLIQNQLMIRNATLELRNIGSITVPCENMDCIFRSSSKIEMPIFINFIHQNTDTWTAKVHVYHLQLKASARMT
jgi:hypothetical protein